MAYFECIIGSGSATAIPLIVTCSQNFAGTTITASKTGARTQTQTCPSSSPYEVTFILPEDGTWTISGVVSGQTFSETVTILPYEANLNDIPEGSTVTPTDDIQTWLHCANIWDKTYTTVSQVLSDASTLQALIASNNAVDYMARSTTWASDVTADQSAMSYIGLNDYCADTLLGDSTWRTAICNSTYFESVLNIKVPTMTSNTTPSGECSASSQRTSGNDPKPAYYAFGGGDTWSSTEHSDQWIQYTFTQKVKVYLAQFKNNRDTGNGQVSNIEIYQTDDGTTLNLLGTYSSLSVDTLHKLTFDNNNYTYSYRIKILGYNNNYSGGQCRASSVNFYGRAQS